MIRIAAPTATAAARSGFAIERATVTPTSADMKFPPRAGHGWARGLAGTANRSTADAPSGAMSKGMAPAVPKARLLPAPARRMPSSAPEPARAASDSRTAFSSETGMFINWRIGVRLCSARRLRDSGAGESTRQPVIAVNKGLKQLVRPNRIGNGPRARNESKLAGSSLRLGATRQNRWR